MAVLGPSVAGLLAYFLGNQDTMDAMFLPVTRKMEICQRLKITIRYLQLGQCGDIGKLSALSSRIYLICDSPFPYRVRIVIGEILYLCYIPPRVLHTKC